MTQQEFEKLEKGNLVKVSQSNHGMLIGRIFDVKSIRRSSGNVCISITRHGRSKLHAINHENLELAE